MFFKINNVDFSKMVSGLKVGYETLVSDSSGRNANGDSVIDVINKKIKVYVTFRHTTSDEMKKILSAISNYVIDISFMDPANNTMKTINVYTGTPEPEYYTISSKTIFKPMQLNFIEL